jgi:hypothetical protein
MKFQMPRVQVTTVYRTPFSSNIFLHPASSLSIDSAFHSVRIITTQAPFGNWMPVVLYKFEELVDMFTVKII